MTSGRSIALQLPDPVACWVHTRDTYWLGGVRVMGTLLCIPGRYIHLDDLVQAEQHAGSVLAAAAMLRGQR